MFSVAAIAKPNSVGLGPGADWPLATWSAPGPRPTEFGHWPLGPQSVGTWNLSNNMVVDRDSVDKVF